MATLAPVNQKFILHWGEMGTRWGINRTVAQIHALLFLSAQPLPAEDIADALDIARSNVSTSLRELQNWKIVKVVHVMGDRRDHFESMKDVFAMFRNILDERKRREIDPTVVLLRDCLAEARKRPDAHVQQRLAELVDFFGMMTAWYEQIQKLPAGAVVKFVKLGDRVLKLVSK